MALAGLVAPFVKARDACWRVPIKVFNLAIDLNERPASDSVDEDNGEFSSIGLAADGARMVLSLGELPDGVSRSWGMFACLYKLLIPA